MTIKGIGSAHDFILQEGVDELLRVAPATIFLVEVVNSTTPWMQPGDLELGNIPTSINHPKLLGIGSEYGYHKFVVGFVDKGVWVLDSSIPFSELEKFMTVEQAMQHDREKVLGQYGDEVEFDESGLKASGR